MCCRLTLRCGPLRERNHDWFSAHPCFCDRRARSGARWRDRHFVTSHAPARDLRPRDRGDCPDRAGPVGRRLGLARGRLWLSRLRLARLRLWLWLAQTLLWGRSPRGRSHRGPCPWDVGGEHELLWLRLSLLLWRVWLLPVFLLCTSLLRLLPVPARLLSAGFLPPGLLPAGVCAARLLPAGFLPPGLLSARLLALTRPADWDRSTRASPCTARRRHERQADHRLPALLDARSLGPLAMVQMSGVTPDADPSYPRLLPRTEGAERRCHIMIRSLSNN